MGLNVELVFVLVENKSKWIKPLVPLIGAIVENSYDPGFCLISVIMGTPGIHWLAYISIMQQAGAKPSATIMPIKIKKSVNYIVDGITM